MGPSWQPTCWRMPPTFLPVALPAVAPITGQAHTHILLTKEEKRVGSRLLVSLSFLQVKIQKILNHHMVLEQLNVWCQCMHKAGGMPSLSSLASQGCPHTFISWEVSLSCTAANTC